MHITVSVRDYSMEMNGTHETVHGYTMNYTPESILGLHVKKTA